MDLGLAGRVVWVVGPGRSDVWDIAATFLEEGACVRLLTTGAGPQQTRHKQLPLRHGRNLRFVTTDRHGGPSSPDLQAHLLDLGPPQVIVAYRTSHIRGEPAPHEWDEFLYRYIARLGRDGAMVLVSTRVGLDDREDALDRFIQDTQACHRAWSALASPHCAVSLIVAPQNPVVAGFVAAARKAPGDARPQGLAPLTVFLATLGRGLSAIVEADGSTHFI